MKFPYLIAFGLILASCGSTPKAALPKSALEASTKAAGGSAIAFQLDHDGCGKGGFQISPLLGDNKYGASETISFTGGLWDFALKGDDIKKLAVSSDDPDRLYVKTLPPAQYAVTRPFCMMGSTRVSTRYEVLRVFLTFEVEPNKTNYIGQLRPIEGRGRLSIGVRDKSEIVQKQFDETFKGRVGELETKLAKVSYETIRATE